MLAGTHLVGVTTSPPKCWRAWRTSRRRRGRRSTSRRLTVGSPPARTRWPVCRPRRTPWPLTFSSSTDSSPCTLYYPCGLHPLPYSTLTPYTLVRPCSLKATLPSGSFRPAMWGTSPSSGWTVNLVINLLRTIVHILFLADYSFLVQLYIFLWDILFQMSCVINFLKTTEYTNGWSAFFLQNQLGWEQHWCQCCFWWCGCFVFVCQCQSTMNNEHRVWMSTSFIIFFFIMEMEIIKAAWFRVCVPMSERVK